MKTLAALAASLAAFFPKERKLWLIAPMVCAIGGGAAFPDNGVVQNAKNANEVLELRGHILTGTHKVKFEAKQVYRITAESSKAMPVVIIGVPGEIHTQSWPEVGRQRLYCMPTQAGDFDLHVHPQITDYTDNPVCDYRVHVKSVGLTYKSLLQKTSQWTNKDPTYDKRPENPYFKAFKITLKGDKLYIINLVQPNQRFQPALFFEDSTGKIVANGQPFLDQTAQQSVKAARYLSERLIHIPLQDGEFRIIAATSGKETGSFVLTVLEAQEKEVAKAKVLTGRIAIGMHEVKMESNTVYELMPENPKVLPQVFASGIHFYRFFSKRSIGGGSEKLYCLPDHAGEFKLNVQIVPSIKDSLDYVLRLKGTALAEQPLLKQTSQWTDQDPTDRLGNYFKGFSIRLKGDRLYVVDLTVNGPGVNPVLRLEAFDQLVTNGAPPEIAAGGDLMSRIVYASSQDGDFRIIAATNKAKATGTFTLTVRQAK